MPRGQSARPEAAAVAWDWRARNAAPVTPSLARKRRAGTIQAAVAASAGVLLIQFVSPLIGRVVLVIAGLVLASALISPAGLYAAIERLFAALGVATGRLLTWLLLVPLFYLFFAPFGRLLRRGRRDRLRRYLEHDATTYWEPHTGVTAASASYERQY